MLKYLDIKCLLCGCNIGHDLYFLFSQAAWRQRSWPLKLSINPNQSIDGIVHNECINFMRNDSILLAKWIAELFDGL